MYITRETLDCLSVGTKYTRPKANKYGAKKIIIDGITFDSVAEGERYCELSFQQHCGIISGLETHPKFILQEKFRVDGKAVSAVKYTADFRYKKDGEIVVEDFKGMKTEAYGIRRRLFLKKFPEYRFLETSKRRQEVGLG